MLLAQGMEEKALEQFEISLLRTRNRARSLLGGARAAVANGKTELAQELYEVLAHLAGAGPNLPGHDEAQQFVASSEDQ
jgi:hypothetical protein